PPGAVQHQQHRRHREHLAGQPGQGGGEQERRVAGLGRQAAGAGRGAGSGGGHPPRLASPHDRDRSATEEAQVRSAVRGGGGSLTWWRVRKKPPPCPPCELVTGVGRRGRPMSSDRVTRSLSGWLGSYRAK